MTIVRKNADLKTMVAMLRESAIVAATISVENDILMSARQNLEFPSLDRLL